MSNSSHRLVNLTWLPRQRTHFSQIIHSQLHPSPATSNIQMYVAQWEVFYRYRIGWGGVEFKFEWSLSDYQWSINLALHTNDSWFVCLELLVLLSFRVTHAVAASLARLYCSKYTHTHTHTHSLLLCVRAHTTIMYEAGLAGCHNKYGWLSQQVYIRPRVQIFIAVYLQIVDSAIISCTHTNINWVNVHYTYVFQPLTEVKEITSHVLLSPQTLLRQACACGSYAWTYEHRRT